MPIGHRVLIRRKPLFNSPHFVDKLVPPQFAKQIEPPFDIGAISSLIHCVNSMLNYYRPACWPPFMSSLVLFWLHSLKR
jgi:hypothetical protein